VSQSGDDEMRIIHPSAWARPHGYSDGMVASGRYVTLAGQIGWNPATTEIETDDLAEQAAQALRNIVTLLSEAGATPRHVVRLTWYVTSRDEYVAARKAIGVAYRELMGTHYPAMSVVVVAGLLVATAKVEIEATAVIPTTS
jgi:enamine deaminase RidA (YjgF/YER057c/UK114 family)